MQNQLATVSPGIRHTLLFGVGGLCRMLYFVFKSIGIKHIFLCINIRWVPREVLKTEGAARGFQHRLRNPANVNARKNMFDRYYCIKVAKKSILERYFDVLFWHYFVLIFLHRRTKIISIYILVPWPSLNNNPIMAETGKNSPRGGRVYKM